MSELLKYLNGPLLSSSTTTARCFDTSIFHQYYSSNWQNKNARVIELLNNFNDDNSYGNGMESDEDGSRLKQRMANVVKIPFKNYQKLNMKWSKDEMIDDDVSVLFSNDTRSVMFHPYKSFGTCAVRGDLELKKNAYTYWQVTVSDRLFGTSVMIGVGTCKARLSSVGYLNLLGADQHSWGLSHKGLLWHSNKSKHYCTSLIENKCVRIGCLYDGYRKTLSYFINDVYMGIAFENVDSRSSRKRKASNDDGIDDTEYGSSSSSSSGGGGGLYPMVASTVSQSIFKIDYFYQTFPSLQDICRTNVKKNTRLFNSIRMEYPYLPKFINDYLED